VKKRINFTGRKNLPLENLKIRIQEPQVPGEAYAFSADLKIPNEWALNKDAKIYVEPYVKSSSMRFSFGTVGDIVPPADTSLSELDHSERILFRVKVVDESAELGKLLASANNIRPLDEEGVRSLLPLKLTDLGEDIWRIVIDGGGPILQLNNRIPGIRDRLMQDPLLRGSIYPQAFRQILSTLFNSDEYDDEVPWVQDWKVFVSRLIGKEFPEELGEEDSESIHQETESILKKFCAWRRFASLVNKFEEKSFNG
jgi:hypothetical protein